MSTHFEKREFERAELKLPIEISEIAEKGLTSDLSLGGLGFVSRQDLESGKEYDISIQTPDEKIIKAKASVRRKRPLNAVQLESGLVDDILEQQDSSKFVKSEHGFQLIGALSASLNFAPLLEAADEKHQRIFLDSAESFNQAGLRNMADKLSSKSSRFHFENAPETFLSEYLKADSLRDISQVDSFYLSYICADCGNHQNRLFQVDRLIESTGPVESQFACDRCSGVMKSSFPVDQDSLRFFRGEKALPAIGLEPDRFRAKSLALFIAENAVPMNVLSAPVFIVNPEAGIEFSNLTAKRIFTSRDSGLLPELFAENFRDLIYSSVSYSAGLLKRREIENVIFIKSGLKYVYKFTLIPVRDEQDKGLATVIILKDKSLDYQLSSSLLELEKRSSLLSKKLNDVAYVSIECSDCGFAGKVIDSDDASLRCPSCFSKHITPVLCFDYGVAFTRIEPESQKVLYDTIQHYAAQQEEDEGRRNSRYTPQNIELDLQQEGGKKLSLSNISRGGLEFMSNEELKLGQKISLSVKLEETAQAVDVFCEILRSKTRVEDGKKVFVYGAKFIYFDSADARKFERFFENMLDQEFVRKAEEKLSYKPLILMGTSLVMVLASIFSFLFFWAGDAFDGIGADAGEKVLVIEEESKKTSFGKKKLYKSKPLLNIPGLKSPGSKTGTEGEASAAAGLDDDNPNAAFSADFGLDEAFSNSGTMYGISDFLNMPEKGIEKLADMSVYDKVNVIKSRGEAGEKVFKSFVDRDIDSTDFMIARINLYRGRIERNSIEVDQQKMDKTQKILSTLMSRKKRLLELRKDSLNTARRKVDNNNYLIQVRDNMSPEMQQKLEDSGLSFNAEEYAKIGKMERSELKTYLKDKIAEFSDGQEISEEVFK